MSISSYIFGIVVSLGALALVIELLRKNKLKEKHAIWWLGLSLTALVVSIFPNTLVWAALIFGVEIPSNLLFIFCIIILFMVIIQLSSENSTMDEKLRISAEKIADLDRRIRDLEQ